MALSRECDYWDTIADKSVNLGSRSFADNSWKRRHQIARLMAYSWLDEKILEVGVGNGLVANALKMVCADTFNYTGTEMSPKFMEWAKKVHSLNVVQFDVREIPGDGYTRIIALDSLEHVRPEHRPEGYKRIYDVAADGALLFIHYSHGISHHDKEFDHPYGLSDLVELEKVGFTLQKYDRYKCEHPSGDIPYVFVVMRK